MKILGIRHGHDSSAAVVVDGKIEASIAEERLSRVKNDRTFPRKAIEACLEIAKLQSSDLDVVAFSSQQLPAETGLFFDAEEDFYKELEFQGDRLSPNNLPLSLTPFSLQPGCTGISIPHHYAHAACAFFTSPIQAAPALIFVMDGVGEGVSISIWKGEAGRIDLLKEFGPEASLGWMYSNATEALGWNHGKDEWKLMGLAPYGTPSPGALKGFTPEFQEGELIRGHEYGSFRRYHERGFTFYHGDDASKLRVIAEELGRENFAAEVQRVAEEQAFQVILPWVEKIGLTHVCCAGGFFLNVKFNQRLWESRKIESQWIYPNPGDAGLAVGAAFAAEARLGEVQVQSSYPSGYLGPSYAREEIRKILEERGIAYLEPEDLESTVAKLLAKNLVVGWFQGRMEDGPRALGSRSILMSPLKAENKDLVNARIKFRERFRPFCPSLPVERRDEYFENVRDEYFMTTSFAVRANKKEKIPAVVHTDGTARPQMVRKEVNEKFHRLLTAFGEITGEPVLLNTSFNLKGEPIVCSPRDALRCFFDSGLDALVLENFLIQKATTPLKSTAQGDC